MPSVQTALRHKGRSQSTRLQLVKLFIAQGGREESGRPGLQRREDDHDHDHRFLGSLDAGRSLYIAGATANLRTKILDVGGFFSSRILI